MDNNGQAPWEKLLAEKENKLLFMKNALLLQWAQEQPKGYAWLLELCSTGVQWAVGTAIPAAVPTTLLEKLGKQAATNVPPKAIGYALLDNGKVSGSFKSSLGKAEEGFIQDLGSGIYLAVWAAATGSNPIMAGVVLSFGVLKFIANKSADQTVSKERWNEILNSIMTKYEAIISKNIAALQKKDEFNKAVEELRKEKDFEEEDKQDRAIVATVPLKNGGLLPVSDGDIVRFKVYVGEFYAVPLGTTYSRSRYILGYVAFRKSVALYYSSASYMQKFNNDATLKAKRKKELVNILQGTEKQATNPEDYDANDMEESVIAATIGNIEPHTLSSLVGGN